MQTELVLCLFAGFCALLGTASAFPENRHKRNPENVIVEVLPVVVYEVPPIPSVIAFDFEEARKGKSKGKESKKTKKSVNKREEIKLEEELKEDLKEDTKIELKGNKAKIEEKLEGKIVEKEEEKIKL